MILWKWALIAIPVAQRQACSAVCVCLYPANCGPEQSMQGLVLINSDAESSKASNLPHQQSLTALILGTRSNILLLSSSPGQSTNLTPGWVKQHMIYNYYLIFCLYLFERWRWGRPKKWHQKEAKQSKSSHSEGVKSQIVLAKIKV